jgi:hypothetical protein
MVSRERRTTRGKGQRDKLRLREKRGRDLQDLHLGDLEQGLRGAQLSGPSSHLLHLGEDGVDYA